MDTIQSTILDCAKTLFWENGFKKTKVSDIMKKANMAAGTFYNYFDSKEALFMEIYNAENVKLKHQIMESINLEDEPLQVLGQLMYLNEEGMKNNPILREWYNPFVAEKIENYFAASDGLNKLEFMEGAFLDIIRHWQQKEKMTSAVPAETILTMFSSLVVMESHKSEVGAPNFDQAFQLMIQYVMDGLIIK